MDLDKKIQSKRHQELLDSFKIISSSISELKDRDKESDLVQAISDQTQLIQSFLHEFKELEINKSKEEGSKNKEENIVTSFESMAQKIVDELKFLREKLMESKKEVKPEWVHTVTKRDYSGRVEVIISKPKTIS